MNSKAEKCKKAGEFSYLPKATRNSNQNIHITITLGTSQAQIPTGNYLSDSDSCLKYQKMSLFLLADSSRKFTSDSQEIKTNFSVRIPHIVCWKNKQT